MVDGRPGFWQARLYGRLDGRHQPLATLLRAPACVCARVFPRRAAFCCLPVSVQAWSSRCLAAQVRPSSLLRLSVAVPFSGAPCAQAQVHQGKPLASNSVRVAAVCCLPCVCCSLQFAVCMCVGTVCSLTSVQACFAGPHCSAPLPSVGPAIPWTCPGARRRVCVGCVLWSPRAGCPSADASGPVIALLLSCCFAGLWRCTPSARAWNTPLRAPIDSGARTRTCPRAHRTSHVVLAHCCWLCCHAAGRALRALIPRCCCLLLCRSASRAFNPPGPFHSTHHFRKACVQP